MISGTRYQQRLEVDRQLLLGGQIARKQAEISSGKKILAPSDDPAAAVRISDIARTQANQATWRANLNKATAISAQADGVLKSLGVAFTRAAELMVAGRNQILSADNREAITLELLSLREHVLALQDTRDSRGDLLFPHGQSVSIPVGDDLELRAVEPQEEIFGSVPSSGSGTLAGILLDAANAMRGGAPSAVASLMAEVNGALDHIASAHARQGTRGNRIDDLVEQFESFAIVISDERTGLESTDIVEAVAELEARQLSLEAAQAVFARINRSNLFDLLG